MRDRPVPQRWLRGPGVRPDTDTDDDAVAVAVAPTDRPTDGHPDLSASAHRDEDTVAQPAPHAVPDPDPGTHARPDPTRDDPTPDAPLAVTGLTGLTGLAGLTG